MVAPSAPSSCARRTSAIDCGYSDERRGWWSLSCSPSATRSQSPWVRPSTSRPAWPMLCTASVSGTCAGSAARALAVRTCLCGTTRMASSSVWTSKRPVSSTSSSMCSPSAAASTSKPGPRLAEDAGTRTSLRLCIDGALDRFDAGLARHDGARLRERGLRVLEPVAGEHARDPVGVARPVLEQPGHAGGRRRLAEDALLAGQEAVRVEDLVVADRVDGAVRAREG